MWGVGRTVLILRLCVKLEGIGQSIGTSWDRGPVSARPCMGMLSSGS